MSINEEIRHIIMQYREAAYGQAPVAFDGVVDEASYLSAPIKAVFLLKEVNGEEKTEQNGQATVTQMTEDWDFINGFMRSQAYGSDPLYPTWPNVCLWVEVLLHPDTNYTDCMNPWGSFDAARLRANLAGVAIVNLKKSPGGGSSQYEVLKKHAQDPSNAELLRKEMDVLAPQVVICGGTFDFAREIWGQGAQVEMLPSGAACFFADGRLFLQFVHPMWYSVNRSILFAYAKTVFADVRQRLDFLDKADRNGRS